MKGDRGILISVLIRNLNNYYQLDQYTVIKKSAPIFIFLILLQETREKDSAETSPS